MFSPAATIGLLPSTIASLYTEYGYVPGSIPKSVIGFMPCRYSSIIISISVPSINSVLFTLLATIGSAGLIAIALLISSTTASKPVPVKVITRWLILKVLPTNTLGELLLVDTVAFPCAVNFSSIMISLVPVRPKSTDALDVSIPVVVYRFVVPSATPI